MAEGKLLATGKVGGGVSADQAKDLAQRCALNALAAVDALVGLENVVKVVKLTGFVASAPGFTGQPGVINGASDLSARSSARPAGMPQCRRRRRVPLDAPSRSRSSSRSADPAVSPRSCTCPGRKPNGDITPQLQDRGVAGGRTIAAMTGHVTARWRRWPAAAAGDALRAPNPGR
jgi:hypothetical protein